MRPERSAYLRATPQWAHDGSGCSPKLLRFWVFAKNRCRLTRRGEPMRRNRYQKGSIKKRCGKWIGQWWENGVRRNRALGPVSTMRKSEAQETMSGDQKFREFVDGPYLGFYLRKWKKSTAGNNVNRIRTHLFPALGAMRLRDVNRDILQAILDEKTTAELSFSVVDHLKWD